MLDGRAGEAAALAMRVIQAMAKAENATRLIEVESAHVDGCLLHGASGVAFAEKLVALGARVRIPTSLNVGAMDLRNPANIRLEEQDRELAVRLMNAYVAMGCLPTWTCAPDQAGFRPLPGSQVAWAESNAVVFANSVLGARTNRYGDFMDICCALTGYAPYSGLHLAHNRRATIVVHLSALPAELKKEETFYPVLGAWLGRNTGNEVAVLDGLPAPISEDRLKALGAAAASSGSVGLFHVVGVTPEAPTLEAILAPGPFREMTPSLDALREERDRMTTARGDQLDVVAVGSPHFSVDEFGQLKKLLAGRSLAVPMYACTGRHVIKVLEARGELDTLQAAGVVILADTCVVVTAVLPSQQGVLMTNSGKFAHYSESLVGHQVVFGSLAECIESAVKGRVLRDDVTWGRSS